MKQSSTFLRQKRLARAIALCSAGLGSVLSAPIYAQDEVLALEEVIVVGKDYYSILPDEPTESAFGLKMSLAETPRSVTEVRADLIEKFALRSVDDLVRLTPGAFTSSFFGIKGAMDIRGEPADNYFRGFRRVANPGAFNTIVRGADKLEILRGPVSPLYGSGSVGGQLNYIPKSAKSGGDKYISEPSGGINVTLGSYNQRIISGDLGVPLTIGDKMGGVHIFAEVEDSESFYHGYEPSSELIQVAFDFDLSDNTLLEFGLQYQHTDSIQVPGWNRVTQELIDNGTYITGAAPEKNTNGGPDLLPNESGFITSAAGVGTNNAFTNVGTFCAPTLGFNEAQYTYEGTTRKITCFGSSSTPWVNPISNPGTTQIDHRTTFIDERDYAETDAFTFYFDLTHTFDNDMVWKNEFFYDYLDHTKYQSWGFTTIYPDVDIMEFRSSLRFDLSAGDINTNNVVGVNYRIEDVAKYDAFFDETFDFRDITVGPTPNDRISPAVQNPDDSVPDRNFNNAELSVVDNAGVFFLSDIALGSFNALIGGRYDTFSVDSEDVAVTLLGNRFDGGLGQVSDDSDAFSYNVSFSYRSDIGLIPYITYAESNSLSTNQVGGISPGSVTSGSYVQPSELSEIGIKYDGESGIYAALAYYDQEKSYRDGQTGALVAVYGKGYEFELRALLTDNLSILATVTHSETTEISDGALAVINGADFAAQNGLTPDQVYGGRIAGNRSTFIGNNVEVERAGLPDNIVSIYGTYTYPLANADITGSVGVTWVDETYTDTFQKVLLPSYDVWTASASYAMDQVTLLLQVNNLFNEEYYTSADLFDSAVVKPSEGRTASVSLSYKF